MSLSKSLTEYISACFTGLWIESHEHDDALREIVQMCHQQNWRLAVWDVAQGLRLPGQNDTPTDAGGSDPLAAIRAINAMASPDSSAILVLVNFHRFMQSAEVVQALVEAAQNVVPVARTAYESVERLRSWASGRCLSADQPGIYTGNPNAKAIKPSRRIRRDPSNN